MKRTIRIKTDRRFEVVGQRTNTTNFVWCITHRASGRRCWLTGHEAEIRERLPRLTRRLLNGGVS